MGWITKHMKSGCHRMKVVSMCVQSFVCWKAVEGTVALISRINPWILSIQSLEAHQHLCKGLSYAQYTWNTGNTILKLQAVLAVFDNLILRAAAAMNCCRSLGLQMRCSPAATAVSQCQYPHQRRESLLNPTWVQVGCAKIGFQGDWNEMGLDSIWLSQIQTHSISANLESSLPLPNLTQLILCKLFLLLLLALCLCWLVLMCLLSLLTVILIHLVSGYP